MLYVSVRYPFLKFNIDDKLKQNLDILLNGVINYKQDALIVIDGEEGSGKTQLSHQLGLYCAEVCNTPFDREGTGNIHNSFEKYHDVAEAKAKDKLRGWVNILDEGRAELGKARSTSRTVKRFTDWLSECRDMGQVHIIILPAYHDLSKYVVLWRMSLLIHMLKEYKENASELGGYALRLGAYKAYANDMHLKETYFIPYYYPQQWAAFNRSDNLETLTPAGVAAIEAQKAKERIKRFMQDQETGLNKDSVVLNGLLAVLHAQGYQAQSFVKLLNVTKQTVYNRINAGKATTLYINWKNNSTGEPEDEK